MRIMKRFGFLVLVLLLPSCIKIKDDLIVNSNIRNVLQSVITTDSLINVTVGYTSQVFDKKYIFNSNATVLLFENNNLIETLQPLGMGKYISTIHPIEKNEYKIIVNDSIVANTIVPEKAHLVDTKMEFPTAYDAANQQYLGTLTFTLIDNPIEENYYELNIFLIDTNYSNNTYNYSFSNDFNYITKPDKIVLEEGDWDYEPSTVFFSDNNFTNKEQPFSFQIASGYTDNGIQIESTLSKRGFIQLRTISKEYYLYRKYFTRHSYNASIHDEIFQNMLFLGEPIDMYTNVKNGLGVMASYSSSINKIEKK